MDKEYYTQTLLQGGGRGRTRTGHPPSTRIRGREPQRRYPTRILKKVHRKRGKQTSHVSFGLRGCVLCELCDEFVATPGGLCDKCSKQGCAQCFNTCEFCPTILCPDCVETHAPDFHKHHTEFRCGGCRKAYCRDFYMKEEEKTRRFSFCYNCEVGYCGCVIASSYWEPCTCCRVKGCPNCTTETGGGSTCKDCSEFDNHCVNCGEFCDEYELLCEHKVYCLHCVPQRICRWNGTEILDFCNGCADICVEELEECPRDIRRVVSLFLMKETMGERRVTIPGYLLETFCARGGCVDKHHSSVRYRFRETCDECCGSVDDTNTL